MLNIGWFSTGRDEAARKLLQVVHREIQRGEIEGNIIFVFSNRETGESEQSDLFFQLVNNYHIPLLCLSSRKFRAVPNMATTGESDTATLPEWRLEYDREVMKRLQSYTPDLCVLAGYMLIVGEEMCHKYNMINLHPARPGGPTGSWQEVIWQLIKSKATESGVVIHLVTPDLDRGPIVTYCTFPIRGELFDRHWQEINGHSIEAIKKEQGENNALFKLIREHGLAREFPLIVTTLKALSRGKIRIEAGRVLDQRGITISGYDLSEEINRMVNLK
ncbi:MAG TPA: phosphoglycerate transporter [Dehalococcoidia bacterium]|nr:phosphoglycerate transporter [Dehalococcoidia bacterium]